MKAMRRFGHLLLAVVFSLGLLLNTSAPIYAADFTGKTITAVSVTGNATVPESQIMAVVKFNIHATDITNMVVAEIKK